MHPLTQKIVALQHRLVWQRRVRAVCWVAAAAIGVAFVLGLADYLLHFKDTGLRIMATFAFALAIAWVAYRAWYLPSQQRLQPLDVARRLESYFPQLQDSLASAVEFLGQSEHDTMAGSAQLRRLVVAEAQNTVETLPLHEIVDRRPLRWAAAALTVAALVAMGCFVLDPSAVKTALARLAVPLGSAQWPRQHHLAFRDVPTQLAAGQTLELELTDTAGPLPDDVRIEFGIARDGGREVTTESMIRAGDVMLARRENVQRSFGFRAAGGDDDTMRWNWVEVVEPPRLESLAINLHPPTYTGLPPASSERHLEVLAGTGIEVNGATSKPIKGARIIQEGLEPIEATVVTDTNGKDRRAFHIASNQWVATKTGPYRLELVDDEGIAGIVGQWNLRVEADAPPGVSWQQPADDLYVLPNAVAPIALLVKDNLAIQQVTLTYERTDRSQAELVAHPTEPSISLYRGSETAPVVDGATTTRGESRVVQYDWDLAPLQLPVGAQITMQAEAQDYRPGIGRTAGPRHISIIDAEKLEARLADRLVQIVRQLERALATEQTTREVVRRLEIEQHDVGGLTNAGRNTLQSAELNQRRVGRMLVDPAEGIPPLVDSILTEIKINRLENSPTRDILERLAIEMRRLAEQPLSIADRELTTARKTVETSQATETHPLDSKTAALVVQAFSTTAAAQDDVIETVERLIGELSGKSDVRRFIRLLTELRQDQIAHEKQARAEIGVDTLPLGTSDLTRAQRANLNKAAAGQDSIASRFDKIEQGLDQLTEQLRKDNSSEAGTLSDAVDLSRQLNIGLDMRQTTSDLRENRVGLALERETQIASNLQKVLGALRNETEQKPQQVVEKLREAEQRLAALREQTAQLRQQIVNAEAKPESTTAQQQNQLNSRQQEIRKEVEKLTRELDRLKAVEAGKSTRSAAKQLDNRDAKSNPNAPAKQPSPSNQIKKAEQDLKQAADQLAQRRQQEEDDLALEFVRRFQTELAEMVERQQRVIKKTTELEAARSPAAALSDDHAKKIANLADEERQLADKAKEHSELLFGLGAVRIGLEEAERRLQAAGKTLDGGDTGQSSQNAEQRALTRLEAMLEAFAQTANEATPKPDAPPPPPPGAGAQNNPPQQQRRPTFELLQAKMLRMLQADLIDRTQQYQQRPAATNAVEKAQMQQDAQELAAEQGRLVELVESMLKRDNEERQEQRP